ncbi:hypothetical protein CALCODRAFT_479325 [Calocera cornea HHB12733]|uniref:Translation initiation factor 3 N-terminal domain-containing protein n=1 Tax=Calocera cornea HHB12733 TaxID=1353952 RepID=A0A165JQ38_9BASI|nr:hypothetical protein CALCODRAFT_479325 [Calocera cornea HHB12733]
MFARQTSSCIASTSRASLTAAAAPHHAPSPELPRRIPARSPAPALPILLPRHSSSVSRYGYGSPLSNPRELAQADLVDPGPPPKRAPRPDAPVVHVQYLAFDVAKETEPSTAFQAPAALREPNASGNGKKPAALRNRDIPHEYVQMPDATGVLQPPEKLADILARIDSRKRYVVLVQDSPAVVKIGNHEEDRRAERARKDAAKAHRLADKSDKEVQLTWSVEPGDLAHKMDKLVEALGQGRRVSVLIAAKPNTRPPGDDKRHQLESRILKLVEDIAVQVQEQKRGRRHTQMFFAPKKTS